MGKYFLSKFVLFAMSISLALAAPLPEDGDGDGLSDDVERWLLEVAGVTTDDNDPALAISPEYSNYYRDQDGDGIPDIIEQYLTHTDATVDNRIPCAGGGEGQGAVDLTGQWGLRSVQDYGETQDFLTQHLSAYSICHSAAGVLKVFHANFGFADSVTFNAATNVLHVTWGAANLEFSGVYDPGNDNIKGNLSGSYSSKVSSARGGGLVVGELLNISGIYGAQVKMLAAQEPFAGTVSDPRNPGSAVMELHLATDLVKIVSYDADGVPAQGFFVPDTGALFVAGVHSRKFDLDGDGNADDELKITSTSRGMFMRIPNATEAARVRGNDLRRVDVTLDADASGAQHSVPMNNMLEWYAVNTQPNADAITFTYPGGQQLGQIALRNVPLSAEQIELVAPGGSVSYVLQDSTDPAKVMSEVVRVRNLIPGLRTDPEVGINAQKTNIAIIPFVTLLGTLPDDGIWQFSIVDDAGAVGNVIAEYTATTAQQALPAVDPTADVGFDDSPWLGGVQRDAVDADINHTITWRQITDGGVLGNGANRYWLHIYHGEGSGGVPLSFTDPDALMMQLDTGAGECPVGADLCNVTLPAGLLEPGAKYCMGIMAQDQDFNRNRSYTDAVFCLSTLYKSGTLQFGSASYTVDESAGTATITVQRVGGTDGAATVAYATGDGSATAGSDYNSASGTLYFSDGQGAQSFIVTILDDSSEEAAETVMLTLSNAGGATLGSLNVAVLTIAANDAPQPVQHGRFAFAAAGYSVNENAGSVELTVQRLDGSVGTVTVDYASNAGSADNAVDFSQIAGTLSFAEGETSKTLTVAIIDDQLVETDEMFTIMLSNAQGGAILDLVTSTSITIVDDDTDQPGSGKETSDTGKKKKGGAMDLSIFALLLPWMYRRGRRWAESRPLDRFYH